MTNLWHVLRKGDALLGEGDRTGQTQPSITVVIAF